VELTLIRQLQRKVPMERPVRMKQQHRRNRQYSQRQGTREQDAARSIEFALAPPSAELAVRNETAIFRLYIIGTEHQILDHSPWT
jgi:hypothetical protein